MDSEFLNDTIMQQPRSLEYSRRMPNCRTPLSERELSEDKGKDKVKELTNAISYTLYLHGQIMISSSQDYVPPRHRTDERVHVGVIQDEYSRSSR
jgi:hypothetical protein